MPEIHFTLNGDRVAVDAPAVVVGKVIGGSQVWNQDNDDYARRRDTQTPWIT